MKRECKKCMFEENNKCLHRWRRTAIPVNGCKYFRAKATQQTLDNELYNKELQAKKLKKETGVTMV